MRCKTFLLCVYNAHRDLCLGLGLGGFLGLGLDFEGVLEVELVGLESPFVSSSTLLILKRLLLTGPDDGDWAGVDTDVEAVLVDGDVTGESRGDSPWWSGRVYLGSQLRDNFLDTSWDIVVFSSTSVFSTKDLLTVQIANNFFTN